MMSNIGRMVRERRENPAEPGLHSTRESPSQVLPIKERESLRRSVSRMGQQSNLVGVEWVGGAGVIQPDDQERLALHAARAPSAHLPAKGRESLRTAPCGASSH